MTSERISGEVISAYESAGKYGGCFGEIRGDDGKVYAWSSGNVYRNFSQAKVGARVSFEVVGHSYATAIDQIDKHSARLNPSS